MVRMCAAGLVWRLADGVWVFAGERGCGGQELPGLFELYGAGPGAVSECDFDEQYQGVGGESRERFAVLNPQGHIQAEIETYALAEELFCVSYAMIRTRLIEGLEKYIIMDDVRLSDQTEEYATLAVEGPKAAELAAGLTGVDFGGMGELESREVSVRGVPCRVIRRSPGGAGGAEFLAKRGEIETLWKVVVEAAQRRGGGPAGYAALNAVRLEQRIPWFGTDFGEKQIPHEAGLQDSHISYTKGCYTGQEIVERVRSRGQVNRVRVSMRFDAAENVAANAALLVEGKEVGFVTRTGFSPGMNAWIGMGYVRR